VAANTGLLTIDGLVLIALQAEVDLRRDAKGKWRPRIHKKAVRDSAPARPEPVTVTELNQQTTAVLRRVVPDSRCRSPNGAESSRT
jgi:hypothetical protein